MTKIWRFLETQKLYDSARLAEGNNLEDRIRNEYLCIVKGDTQGGCRAMRCTLNKTARGDISTELARILCEGGIY